MLRFWVGDKSNRWAQPTLPLNKINRVGRVSEA